jgi:hypothetical protein
MKQCEDWPCCGHERGLCPDFDESGQQLNMKCICGATVSINSRSSLCVSCLRNGDDDYERWGFQDEQEDEIEAEDARSYSDIHRDGRWE